MLEFQYGKTNKEIKREFKAEVNSLPSVQDFVNTSLKVYNLNDNVQYKYENNKNILRITKVIN